MLSTSLAHVFGDDCPAISVFSYELKDPLVFFETPLSLFDDWVEVIKPFFTAMVHISEEDSLRFAVELEGYGSPVGTASLFINFCHDIVEHLQFLFFPRLI